MDSLKTLFDGMSDVQKDLFVAVTTDLQASSPEDKLRRLSGFLFDLKREIDVINRRREALGNIKNNVESLIRVVEDKLTDKEADQELVLFLDFLKRTSCDLREEIDEMKPENKLQKKFAVSKKLERLQQRQRVSCYMYTRVVKDEPVVPPAQETASVDDDLDDLNGDEDNGD